MSFSVSLSGSESLFSASPVLSPLSLFSLSSVPASPSDTATVKVPPSVI